MHSGDLKTSLRAACGLRGVLFGVLLGIAMTAGRAGASGIGDYTSHEVVPAGVRLEAGADTVYVRFYAGDVVGIDFRPAGSGRDDSSLVMIRRPDPAVDFQVTDVGPAIEISAAGVIVRVEKSPVRFSFLDGVGWQLVSEAPEVGLESPGNLSRVHFVLPADIHFYGTGERGIGIDLRGYSFGMYNTQVFGYSTPLETMKINVPFLATSRGYALYFDTTVPGGLDLGRTDPDRFFYRQESHGLSYFVLAAPTVEGQLELYTWLTGRHPMPPKWSLGYLQSKYGYRTRGEAETMVRTMRARGIPADAVILDLYWFRNMGDLAWDVEDFPNPQGMVADFLGQGLRTVLIAEPYFTEPSQYYYQLVGPLKDFVAQNWLGEAYLLDHWWSCGCDAVLFDVTDPGARTWLWDRYEDLFRTGISGLWTDLGEPERHPWDMEHYAGDADEVHDVYNLLWARAIYQGFSAYRPSERLFNLTRSGYAGIQRYGVFTWSGDVSRSYGGLAVQVPIMLNTSLSGLAYHSSDLGGFTGWASPELYVRWMEFGAFNPVMRAHGVDNQGTEPWGHGEEAETIVTDYIRLRYSLMPYIYSLAWDNHRTGMPLARPLFFCDPGDPDLAGLSDSFLFGPDILVGPVTTEGARERDVYLPQGGWVDFWTDSLYTGPGTVTAAAPLDRIPLFIRVGALLPMEQVGSHVREVPPDTLFLHIYPRLEPGREEFSLYEDDGVSRDYERGSYALTAIAQEVVLGPADTLLYVTVGEAVGGFSQLPEERTVVATVHLAAGAPDRVRHDSLDVEPCLSAEEFAEAEEGYFFDLVSHLLYIKMEHGTRRPSSLEITGWRARYRGRGNEGIPALRLGRSRPNPFSNVTTIPYRIAEKAWVKVEVFSPQGKKIATLVDASEAPGEHSAFWDGRDRSGRRSAPGVYFCRLASRRGTRMAKLVLLR
jgi:alpha-glucosidase (family GH31 glycosyl hydrolase)